MKPLCIVCQAEYSPKHLELGYRTCLECGGAQALKEKKRKARCTAPAYNKGAYQYVGSTTMARGVGR